MPENYFTTLKNLFFVLFILKFSDFYSQPEISRSTNQKSLSLTHTYSIQKFDNFLVHSIGLEIKRIHLSTSLGCGLNRTFFQNRFFPLINIAVGYKLMGNQKISIYSDFTASYFTFKAIERHYFTAYQLGYDLKYGKKLFLSNRAGVGILNEKFKNTEDKTVSASTLHYQLSIGFGYAF